MFTPSELTVCLPALLSLHPFADALNVVGHWKIVRTKPYVVHKQSSRDLLLYGVAFAILSIAHTQLSCEPDVRRLMYSFPFLMAIFGPKIAAEVLRLSFDSGIVQHDSTHP